MKNKANQELIEAKELLEKMFSNVSLLIAYMDRDFNFLRVNRTYAEADGHDPDYFIGKNHFDLFPNGENKAIFEKVVATGEPFYITEKPFEYADHPEWGITYWDWSLQPVKDEHGKTQGLVLSLSNVTGRKQAQDGLRVANAYNRSLIEASLDPLVTITPEGKVGDVNAATEAVTGYSRAELIGTDFHSYFTDPDKARAGYRQVFEKGSVRDYELEIRHKNGAVTPVLYNASIYRDESGQVRGVIAAARDITERKRAEDALRIAGAYNRSLIEASLDPLVTIGPDGKITDVNAATEAATGCPREELIGTDFSDYFTDPARARAGYEKVFREGLVRDYGLELRHRDGHTTSVLYNASVYRDESGQVIGVFAAARDITERKRAAEITSQLAAIVESSDDAIISKTLEGNIVSWNAGAERLYGYRAEEVIGRSISILLPPNRADDLPEILTRVKLGENINHLETTRWTHDGHLVDVSLTISPIKDASGEIVGASTIAHDMSERVRYEKEILRLNAELEQRVAERTAQLNESNQLLVQAKDEAEQANNAKSEFLSRMSHELRTPLNSILGFAQLLEMYEMREQPGGVSDPALMARQVESLDQILKAGKHLLDLINEVLEISRIETGRISLSPEPILASEIVLETLDLIRPLAAHKNLILETELAGLGCRYVTADRQRLKEVFLNLLSNAVKFNLNSGRITFACQEADEGKWLRFSIRDTGRGISTEMLPRIFVPFERLGAERSGIEGTGLGLALSKRLVEAMGGVIGVESSLGEGSNFWVELPLVEGPLEKIEREESVPSQVTSVASRKKYTVLYVEDNLSNLNLIKRLLEFKTETRLLTAMQGGLGIELAREHKPNLILLDLNLPDIAGLEVLHRLQAEEATRSIPVVIISADAMPSQIERLRAAGARAYLTKPLDVKKFIAVMDEILGK